MKRVEAADRVIINNDVTQHVLPGLEESLAEVRTIGKEKLLRYYFTDPKCQVLAIKGTMEPVVAAALIARFSRAEDTDVTEIFGNEFVADPILGIRLVSDYLQEEEGYEYALAQDHARTMIKRIIDRFGDDSVREQASGYIIIQNHSVLASLQTFLHPLAKGIEASTRYIEWGEKENGDYRYLKPRSS